MEQLRRVLLVGLEDSGFRAHGLQVEEVSLDHLREEAAASPQGSVVVLGRGALAASALKDLSEVLRRPVCIPFVCPDGADGLAIARWARESGFEFVGGPALPSRIAAAARVPMREAVPISEWAPARAIRSTELVPALEILAGLPSLTPSTWARSLGLSRFQLYRLCMRHAGDTPDRLTWLCLRATVNRLETTGLDPARVHVCVGYSSARALRRALKREFPSGGD
jgi:AraC-like DNA-binding protein